MRKSSAGNALFPPGFTGAFLLANLDLAYYARLPLDLRGVADIVPNLVLRATSMSIKRYDFIVKGDTALPIFGRGVI